MAYVFISYSSKNQMAADHFKKILDRNGIHSWMAPGDIPLGSKYAQVINKAIRNSSGLLLLLTDNAQKSIWVPKEVERAINYQKPLIPVMLEDVILNDEFEFYICNDQGIAISQIDEKTPEMQQVLAILRKITSEENSQEVVSQYIVAKTPKMKRKFWLKQAMALLTALVMIGVGVGISYLFRFDREEPVQPVIAAVMEDAEWYYNVGAQFENSSPANLEDALKSYLAAADRGYTRSYLAVGRVSMELEQYAQAAEYLNKATAYYDDAYVLLGHLYEDGLGVERSLKEAETLYQHGHRLNNNDATCALARLYASAPAGSGVTADVELAKQLYAGIADKHPESAFRLGLLCESSNRELAIQWMKKAYERGYAAAEYRLSELLPPDELAALQAHAADPGAEHAEMSTTLSDEALTIQKPDNTAEVLLRAAQGDLQAKLEAACLYYNGSEEDKIPVDHHLALANLLAAGDEVYTHADAMMILAYYYEGNEDVVDADIDKAVKLYTEAAKKGNLTACYRLAKGYCEGDLNGGTPDYREGYGWAFQGAQKENPGCMNALGMIYHKGRLTGEPDIEEAMKWYTKAAELEFPAAMTNLGRGYADGTLNGGTPDYGIAKEWYVKAAALDNAEAKFQLGYGYNNSYYGDAPDRDKALEWYLAAAKQNHSVAMHNLGVGYANGNFNGGTPDYGIAKDWYLKAADLGYSNSMNSLGVRYHNGTFNDGVPDYDEALKWYKQAADLGNSTAIQNIAENYEDGDFSGGTPNYEEAESWFRKAADKGMAHSMYHLGRGYANGNYNGGTPDYAKAVEWYEKAAEQKEENSLVALAELYLNGKKDGDGDILVAEDKERALRIVEALAEINVENTYALSVLGWFYAGNSEVLEADYARSVEYYEAAAKLGDAYSMYNLGLLYRDGRLGEPDYKMAEQWYLDAAKLGYAESMFGLGYGYYEGYYGDAPDYDKSLEWYTKAAEQNHAVAMNNLGVGYHNGVYNGGTPDYAKAVEWYEKAAALNDESAIMILAELYMNGRKDEAGNVLVPISQKDGFRMLKKAAEVGNKSIFTFSWLGWFYAGNSEVLEADYPKSVAYYEKAAALGDAYSMHQLGLIYQDTRLGEPDYKMAEKWYLDAAEQGHSAAMNNLGAGYHNGNFNGGTPDFDKALEWYTAAADLNYAPAMRNIAENYADGDYSGGTPDYAKAVEWYKKAAAQNDENAIVVLAELCLNGRKDEDGEVLLPISEEDGFRLLRKAEEVGNKSIFTFSWLGWFYAGNSEVVEADYAMAAVHYEAAAKLGDAYSMHNLGLIYKDARLGTADYEMAMEWFEKAARQEYGASMCELGVINMRCLDEPNLAEAEYWLTKALSTDKKERAEELLQELEEMKAE